MHHIFITKFIDDTLQCRLVEKDKSDTWHDLIHSHMRSNGFVFLIKYVESKQWAEDNKHREV